MVPAGNKTKRLSSVNHTTETIHLHHHPGVQSLQRCYIKNEKEKKRQYNMRVLQVENGSFTSLAFNINGEMRRKASKCCSRIAAML